MGLTSAQAPYFLGIDFGTSGARAIVIDELGELQVEVAASFEPALTPDSLAPTWRSLLFKLIQQLPICLRGQLRRLAINGTSATLLLCDSTGEPLLPPLLYNDARATEEVQTLRQLVPADHVVLSASSTLAKALWLSRQPAWKKAHCLLHQADWLGFCLHGQLGLSDYHNSLKLGYDVAGLHYPDWFEQSPLQNLQSLLPEVLAPGTVIAPVRPELATALGIPQDCQVCAGTTDSIAAFIASGADQPGTAVTSLGSTLVLKLLSQTRVERAEFGIYSHRFGSLWLTGGASNAGGAILKHYFTPAELVQLSTKIDPEQSVDLDYYPLLHPGERFPINDPGLNPRLEPRPPEAVTFLQGLLEGLARIETRGYQLLMDQGATPLTQVFTAGGGAQNLTWTRIRQRYLQRPILNARHTQAAYGTALLALHRGLPVKSSSA